MSVQNFFVGSSGNLSKELRKTRALGASSHALPSAGLSCGSYSFE